jgi:hypothetical protein
MAGREENENGRTGHIERGFEANRVANLTQGHIVIVEQLLDV